MILSRKGICWSFSCSAVNLILPVSSTELRCCVNPSTPCFLMTSMMSSTYLFYSFDNNVSNVGNNVVGNSVKSVGNRVTWGIMDPIRIFANFQQVLRYFKVINALAESQHTNQSFTTCVIGNKWHILYQKNIKIKLFGNGPCNPIGGVRWTQGSMQPHD